MIKINTIFAKKIMNTITVQATFNANDFVIFQSLFEKFNVKTTVINERETNDFFHELSSEDIGKIELGRSQIKKGMSTDSKELQKRTREKYGDKMGY